MTPAAGTPTRITQVGTLRNEAKKPRTSQQKRDQDWSMGCRAEPTTGLWSHRSNAVLDEHRSLHGDGVRLDAQLLHVVPSAEVHPQPFAGHPQVHLLKGRL